MSGCANTRQACDKHDTWMTLSSLSHVMHVSKTCGDKILGTPKRSDERIENQALEMKTSPA